MIIMPISKHKNKIKINNSNKYNQNDKKINYN